MLRERGTLIVFLCVCVRDLDTFLHIFVRSQILGASGWLSLLSVQLLISAWVMILGSWDQALCQAPH